MVKTFKKTHQTRKARIHQRKGFLNAPELRSLLDDLVEDLLEGGRAGPYGGGPGGPGGGPGRGGDRS